MAGCSFGEVPIIFTNRARGTSKISQNEIIKAMYTVLRLGLSRLLPHRHKIPTPPPIEKKYHS
jgi:hypothetical protein